MQLATRMGCSCEVILDGSGRRRTRRRRRSGRVVQSKNKNIYGVPIFSYFDTHLYILFGLKTDCKKSEIEPAEVPPFVLKNTD